jgi:hypothetical protein
VSTETLEVDEHRTDVRDFTTGTVTVYIDGEVDESLSYVDPELVGWPERMAAKAAEIAAQDQARTQSIDAQRAMKLAVDAIDAWEKMPTANATQRGAQLAALSGVQAQVVDAGWQFHEAIITDPGYLAANPDALRQYVDMNARGLGVAMYLIGRVLTKVSIL